MVWSRVPQKWNTLFSFTHSRYAFSFLISLLFHRLRRKHIFIETILFTNGTKLAEHISNHNRSLNSHVRTEGKKLIVNHTFARREFLENHVKSERSKWIIVIVRRELKGQCITIISSLLSATAGSPQATLFLLGVQASVTVHAFWALTGQAPGSRELKKWHTF